MNGAIDYMAYRLTQPSNPVDEPAKAGLLIFTAELLANAKAHLRANISNASAASYRSSPVGCSAKLGCLRYDLETDRRPVRKVADLPMKISRQGCMFRDRDSVPVLNCVGAP
jgi:hypothetical protein